MEALNRETYHLVLIEKKTKWLSKELNFATYKAAMCLDDIRHRPRSFGRGLLDLLDSSLYRPLWF